MLRYIRELQNKPIKTLQFTGKRRNKAKLKIKVFSVTVVMTTYYALIDDTPICSPMTGHSHDTNIVTQVDEDWSLHTVAEPAVAVKTKLSYRNNTITASSSKLTKRDYAKVAFASSNN